MDKNTAKLVKPPKWQRFLQAACCFAVAIALLTGFSAVEAYLAGIVIFLVGLYRIFNDGAMLEGDCPTCGHTLKVGTKAAGATCPACKKRCVVKGKNLVPIA